MIARADFNAAAAVDRVLLVMELLQASSCALSTGTLQNALADRTGRDWSRDTLTRDLRLLLSRGLVSQSGAGRGATVTWRWVGAMSLRPSA
jgi:predicted DNA-binding transcriptional regulator YafY